MGEVVEEVWDAHGVSDEESALSVTESVGCANRALSGIGAVTVLGEVSGFRGPNARSGHCYFSLKDEDSSLDVIVWRWTAEKLRFELRDGLQLLVTGAFDVYKSGKMSFKAAAVRLAGEGLLRQKIDELARRLQAEGLMNPQLKRPVPAFCQRVCVVTSLSGSVIEDVRRTLARRNPLVAIDVIGAPVQGTDAPPVIVKALRAAERTAPDAILLVRGGGSLEDLMPFNDEAVARAVADITTRVPVVTGIGHEPDTSIADMVASRRASTPTAAAEGVAPTFEELLSVTRQRAQRLVGSLLYRTEQLGTGTENQSQRLSAAMGARLAATRQTVGVLGASTVLKDPTSFVTRRLETLELSAERLDGAMGAYLRRRRETLGPLGVRLANGGARICSGPAQTVQAQGARLVTAGPTAVQRFEAQLGRQAAALDALSPLKVLGRGYGILESEEGHVIDSVAAAQAGEHVSVRLKDGRVLAQVTGTAPARTE